MNANITFSLSKQGALWARLASLLLLMLWLAGCEQGRSTQKETEERIASSISATSLSNPDVSAQQERSSRLQQDVEAYMREFQPGPLPRLFQTTRLYDRNGILIAELFNEGRREWIPLAQISPYLIEATVAVEDATFFTNLGIDPMRVASAALQNVKQGEIVSGASTITMQLARNIFMTPAERMENTLERKQLEAQIARDLTRAYTKDEILEMYLNLLNYGHLAYGPEAAARVYFGKSAAELTQAEAILLAGIPQQPAGLDPYIHLEDAKQRQRIVLDVMVRKLKLTAADADALYQEPIVLAGEPGLAPNLAPHFVQYMQSKLNAQLGNDYVARSGLNIYTTLDLSMQQLGQEIAAKTVARQQARYGMNNAALVAMRPGSSELMVMVGSIDFDNEAIDGQVNVALSPRQPGSSIKPILYVTAFNDLLISPATALWDTQIRYDVGTGIPYIPQNYDNKFHGLVTARTALANSYNVPAVKVLAGLGVDRMLESARAMGLQSLNRENSQYGLPLALGEGEVTLLDMATAFTTIANGGIYLAPTTVVTALDKQNLPSKLATELLNADRPQQSQRVLSAGAAFVVTDILSDNTARTPMFGPNSYLRLSKPAAAKTGTTTGPRDNWTIGFSRYLTAAVWVGNTDNRPMNGSTGASSAAPIWHDFMEAVLANPTLLETLGAPTEDTADDSAWAFIPPPDVEQRAACLPGLACRQGGEYFTHDWLVAAGASGPLGDMLITAPTQLVHPAAAWLPIYCTQAGGTERTLTKVGGLVGFSKVAQARIQKTVANLVNGPGIFRTQVEPDSGLTNVVFFPHNELERFLQLARSRQRGDAVNVGACAEQHYYTVQPGDYWRQVAEKFGIETWVLQMANAHAMRNSGYLQPGDRLLAPAGIIIEVNDNVQRYTVQSGDTWAQISQSFGVSLSLLAAANPALMRPGFLLKPGDEIVIPDTGVSLN